jgi:glycosyltransferase involved in cell wall biosynthesis
VLLANMSSTSADSPSARIYYLTEEFYPPQVGGVELMVSYLSHGLAARGIATQVITRQPDSPAAAEETLGRVRVRRIRPGGQLKGRGWRALPAVLGYLCRLAFILLSEAGRYDVVIISGLKIIPLVAIPVTRLLGKRCIIRVESTFELAQPLSAESLGSMGVMGRWLHAMLARVQRYVLNRADPVVAISREVESMLLGLGVAPARIALIPNGIDLKRFRPAHADEQLQLRKQLSIPPAATVMLFAGRLSKAKGIVRLVELWPQIIARYPNLYLLIVGSGAGSFDDCEEELANIIRERRLERYVVMAGATDRVEDYLRAADVFVYPSHYEGFGLGVIEALACGQIVAVTPVGVAGELIQHGANGFLFRVDDSAAMLSAIDTALASEERWPAIRRQARTAAAAFDLDAIVTQYAELCRPMRR